MWNFFPAIYYTRICSILIFFKKTFYLNCYITHDKILSPLYFLVWISYMCKLLQFFYAMNLLVWHIIYNQITGIFHNFVLSYFQNTYKCTWKTKYIIWMIHIHINEFYMCGFYIWTHLNTYYSTNVNIFGYWCILNFKTVEK